MNDYVSFFSSSAFLNLGLSSSQKTLIFSALLPDYRGPPLGAQVTQSMDKLVVLVDVQNIYYTTKQSYDCNFDYNKFWAKVTSNRKVIKAIAYAIDRNDEKQRQFQNDT